MRMQKLILFLLIVSLLAGLGPFPLKVGAQNSSLLVNGDFQTDATGDWKPDGWVASSEIEPYTWVSGSDSKVLSVKAPGSAASGTIAQNILRETEPLLEDGIYSLEMKVKGEKELIESFRLMVKGSAAGDALSGELKDGLSNSSFATVRLDGIKVVGGCCTVGIAVELKEAAAWTWIFDIDDAAFYKTGEINYAVNGGFEAMNDSWKPESWAISPGVNPYFWSDNAVFRSGARGMKAGWSQGAESDPQGTVSQVVNGQSMGLPALPDGLYTLEVWAKWGDSSGDGLNGLRLFAANTGAQDVESENLASILTYGSYTCLKLENIEVRGGQCTIGISFDFKRYNNEIITLDDLSFYKTADAPGAAPEITDFEELLITTPVGRAPVLPPRVQARYSNGSSREVAVLSWEAIEEALYSAPEMIGKTFEVEGSVEGTAIPVKALVSVTYKSFDMDGNSAVDIGDLAYAASVYLTVHTGNGWGMAQKADVNNDKIVDLADLSAIADDILRK